MTIPTNLRIDGNRLLWRLETLARIGDTGDGGCRRLALSDEDREGRDLLVSWMRELGLDVRVDRIGNILGLMAGERDGPAVMLGSHIDTVATGGRYDGALGVLAALEAVAALKEAGITPKRPVAVIAFTNEEGVRFHPDILGSCVWTGTLRSTRPTPSATTTALAVGDELRRIGYAGRARARRRRGARLSRAPHRAGADPRRRRRRHRRRHRRAGDHLARIHDRGRGRTTPARRR